MFYFDTSVMAALVLDEPTGAKIEHFVAGLPSDRLAVSQWTRVEFSSALARLVRMGTFDRRAAAAADRQFESLIADAFAVLLPTTSDYELAKNYLAQPSSRLRAGDAFHLAVAANNRAEAILTLDKVLLAAGSALGLPMSANLAG